MDIEIIKTISYKKKMYGNNFEDIAIQTGLSISKVLEVFITQKASRLSRLYYRKELLQKSLNSDICKCVIDNINECFITNQSELEEVEKRIKDTMLDLKCYTWIKENYNKYLEL